jgi:hypothetical protein
VERRIVAPPPIPGIVLVPWAGTAAEHVAAHDGRADVGLDLLHHRRAGVDLSSLQPVRLPPCLEHDDPFVEVLAADPERVFFSLIGAGHVPVQ